MKDCLFEGDCLKPFLPATLRNESWSRSRWSQAQAHYFLAELTRELASGFGQVLSSFVAVRQMLSK